MTTWILLRAAGVGAYVMLFMAVAWGLVATTAVVTKHVSKPAANMFHQFVATTGLVLLGVHMAILLIDAYMPFHVLDLLVPMRSTFRPVAITAGVIAMYAMVAVMVSSWVRKKLSTKVWRSIHLLAVPAFTLALAHGVFSGTDTQRWWMFGMYALTGLIVVFLVIVRGLSYGYRAPRPAPPERATRAPRAAAAPGTAPEPTAAAEPPARAPA
ncbi:MAG: ferric reductase-like transmembrane domain-containing protein [Actinomycetota bacterium]